MAQTPSLAEKYGLSVEPSRLTQKQRDLLNSESYYFEAARAIGTNRQVIVQVGRSSDLLNN